METKPSKTQERIAAFVAGIFTIENILNFAPVILAEVLRRAVNDEDIRTRILLTARDMVEKMDKILSDTEKQYGMK